MRKSGTSKNGHFSAKAYAGIHTVLLALDCKPERRRGLLGFSIQRSVGAGGQPKWLRSLKVFKSVVPHPEETHAPNDPQQPAPFYSDKFPVQSFLWGDYAASPGTAYTFRILPRYGQPGALTTEADDEVTVTIETEKEW